MVIAFYMGSSKVKFRILGVVAMLAGLFLAQSLHAAAAAPAAPVMVSARPLAMLYLALRPQQPVEILLPSDRDMHDYSLQVADIKRVQAASLFFWLGPASEPFLQALAQRFAGAGRWVAVADKHGHAWLDQQYIPLLVAAMATALAEQYPAEKASIGSREQALLAAIDERYRFWRERLQPYAHTPFVLGHDAFAAFAANLGLGQALLYRATHDHGHVQAGMHELLALQQRMASAEITCALEEPEVSFAALARRYKTLKLARLEPMATSIPLSEQAYIAFIDASAQAFETCLK